MSFVRWRRVEDPRKINQIWIHKMVCKFNFLCQIYYTREKIHSTLQHSLQPLIPLNLTSWCSEIQKRKILGAHFFPRSGWLAIAFGLSAFLIDVVSKLLFIISVESKTNIFSHETDERNKVANGQDIKCAWEVIQGNFGFIFR